MEGVNKNGVVVAPGDWVIDHLDNGHMRKVSHIWENEVNMEDGGVMDLDEIGWDDIFLPGEKDGYN